MIKAGSPEDMDRIMARLDADKARLMDDSSPIRDFPKYGRPLVRIKGIYGKAVALVSQLRSHRVARCLWYLPSGLGAVGQH